MKQTFCDCCGAVISPYDAPPETFVMSTWVCPTTRNTMTLKMTVEYSAEQKAQDFCGHCVYQCLQKGERD